MPKTRTHFKTAALMVVNHSPNDKNKAVVQLICKGSPAISVHEEGAALLLDYLVIARAFFCQYEEGTQKLNDFCAKLVKVLGSACDGRAVDLPEIRQLINEMGCLTDWVRMYPPNNF